MLKFIRNIFNKKIPIPEINRCKDCSYEATIVAVPSLYYANPPFYYLKCCGCEKSSISFTITHYSKIEAVKHWNKQNPNFLDRYNSGVITVNSIAFFNPINAQEKSNMSCSCKTKVEPKTKFKIGDRVIFKRDNYPGHGRKGIVIGSYPETDNFHDRIEVEFDDGKPYKENWSPHSELINSRNFHLLKKKSVTLSVGDRIKVNNIHHDWHGRKGTVHGLCNDNIGFIIIKWDGGSPQLVFTSNDLIKLKKKPVKITVSFDRQHEEFVIFLNSITLEKLNYFASLVCKTKPTITKTIEVECDANESICIGDKVRVYGVNDIIDGKEDGMVMAVGIGEDGGALLVRFQNDVSYLRNGIKRSTADSSVGCKEKWVHSKICRKLIKKEVPV